MQGCDFINDFYTAGAMMRTGQGTGIYPPVAAASFIGAPFDNFCKQLLPYLPTQTVAIYFYSPLVALLFAPFSLLPAPAALVLFQVIMALVLLLVGLLLNGRNFKKAFDFVFMAALFCPVFHTLLIGQLGIVFGLPPLALAYYCLIKNKHFAAGLAFSLLALKPQYMPTALLVCGALFLCRKPKTTLGLLLGLVAFCLINVIVCGPNLFMAWLHSFKMFDSVYANPIYGFGEHLVVCLPAVLLQFFPHALRESVKLPVYGLSAVIGLFALWRSFILLRFAIGQDSTKGGQVGGDTAELNLHFNQAIGLVMSLGLVVLTLVVPHFLFYDLCAFVLIGRIAFQDFYPLDLAIPIRTMRAAMWWVSNIYFILFMFAPIGPLKQWFPLVLVAFYAYFFYAMIIQMSEFQARAGRNLSGLKD
jgi:hypothetical protein